MNDPYNSQLIESAWKALPAEILAEFHNILSYWARFTVDPLRGGFVGKIDQDNQAEELAARGSVLNTRILWTFSAAYCFTKNPHHLELADRAYQYILNYLTDPEFGGLYWSVDHLGRPLDDHKQVYAQAFGIYAMSEYYRASKNAQALEQALEWYKLIEEHSRDKKHGGYIDAFARNWSYLEDKRLSEKDENASKTMNTHLHIVEAYANLFEVWSNALLKSDIISLLNIFDKKIIHKPSYHLGLFFSDEWQMDDSLISYGHDIEAAWLLQSCAESIRDEAAITTSKNNAIRITDAAMEGLDDDGGLWYEYNTITNERIDEKHWWPQAEALVGLCNAWQLTKDTVYKTALLKNWNFIRHHILDITYGEWYWGLDKNKNKMAGQDKVGFWKCPYHNSRACLELIRRLKNLEI